MEQINRRTFIGAAAAGTVALGGVLNQADAASDTAQKLKLGLIGCGWYGMVDAKAALKVGGVEIVALCDVDGDHLAKNADEIEKLQGSRPKTFKLYDDLLKTPGLEAVIIASPPQWHALQFIAACEKGLDIYCEKPLAYDLREGRAMVEAAKKSGRIVQIGFQRRQAAAIRQARSYIQEGNPGRVVCVEAQIHYTAGTKDATPQAPPPSLDWDLWCGPAPKIPYSPQVGHMNWRLEKTTGHGHLVDWGIHLIDATRWILGESTPRTVSASGGIYQLKDKITTPDVLTAHFEFEKCPVTWRHRIWGAEEYAPEVSNGLFFYGEKETVFVTDDKWIVIPRGKGKERKVNEAKSDAGKAHMADFLDAVRTRQQPSCLIEDAFQSTATVKLAMIAYDTGAKITWDGKAEQIVGHDAAAKLLKREYRAPWQHPWRR
ncbi:MAG: Gfo/Idh/MocA family oxidoreductase [Verrucomicrobia bacterium]|nr:Gfo/Idh/MocA family oxidoreductase [Verrucomicrobiota bacterium]